MNDPETDNCGICGKALTESDNTVEDAEAGTCCADHYDREMFVIRPVGTTKGGLYCEGFAEAVEHLEMVLKEAEINEGYQVTKEVVSHSTIGIMAEFDGF